MNFAWNAQLPRSIQESFTCHKSTTWDRRLYFPSEGRCAEDFFRPEKSDGFGRVWTRELGYQRPEQSPYWGNKFPQLVEVPYIFCNLNIHYHVQKRPPLVSILYQSQVTSPVLHISSSLNIILCHSIILFESLWCIQNPLLLLRKICH